MTDLWECEDCGRVFENETALVFCCNPKFEVDEETQPYWRSIN